MKLISDSSGNYHFTSTAPILKKCEGKWYTSSDDTEGNCIGYVKQKNLKEETTGAFSIVGEIEDTVRFIIPFKKVSE